MRENRIVNMSAEYLEKSIELSATAKNVLGKTFFLMDTSTNKVYESISQIARECDLSRQTVNNGMKELIDEDVVRKTEFSFMFNPTYINVSENGEHLRDDIYEEWEALQCM